MDSIVGFLYSKPGNDVVNGTGERTVFHHREINPPVKVKVKYYLRTKNGSVWRDVTVKSVYPKCIEDVTGWQKPFWCIEDWKEI